jgi:tetratricopeptide (TPR) repeat protein
MDELVSMNALEWLFRWVGNQTDAIPEATTELYNALENGRRLKRLGDYEAALGAFDQAETLLSGSNPDNLPVMIALNRVDVFTLQKQWDAAERLLSELQSKAEQDKHNTRLAYILCARGALAQEKGDWETARRHYECALELSRATKAIGAEGRAQGHLADTYLREDNASFASYLLQEALPKLEFSGDVELSSYFSGRLGSALIAMGREREGLHMLGRALRIAEQLEYKRYELMWRRTLAAYAMQESNYAEARRHLMLALTKSDPESDLVNYVQTLCRLSKTCLRLNELQAALEYAQQAVALVDEHSELHSERLLAYAALGICLRTMGRSVDAIPYLLKASETYEHINIESIDYTYVDILRNLAAAQAESNNAESARATYQRAIDFAGSHSDLTDVAGTYRDLGILYGQIGEFDDAIQAWMTALQIYQDKYQYARSARLYCDIANLRKQQGNLKRAIKDYEQALMLLASANEVETRGIVLANAATAYVDQGDIASAESFFIESIQIAQSLKDRPAEATRRGNYGWFLLSTGRAKQGLVALDYALRQSQNLGLKLQVAVQTDNMGLAHDELREFDKAVDYHRQALELLPDTSGPHWRAIISANLAHSLIGLGEATEAESLLSEALRDGRSMNNTEIVARALNGLAKIALNSNELSKADTLLDEAISIAERSGLRRFLADGLCLRSRLRAMQSDFDQSGVDWELARQIFDILKIDSAQALPEWLQTSPQNS